MSRSIRRTCWSNGDADRLPGHVADLAGRKVNPNCYSALQIYEKKRVVLAKAGLAIALPTAGETAPSCA